MRWLPAPQVLDVAIDASDVPSDYILAILSQCSTFPETLIFFLKGKLLVRALGRRLCRCVRCVASRRAGGGTGQPAAAAARRVLQLCCCLMRRDCPSPAGALPVGAPAACNNRHVLYDRLQASSWF